MANAFNLTAQINLRGPTNLKPIVADIRRQLGSISANVNLNLDAKSAKGIEAVTNRLTAMNTILAQAKSNADGLASTLQGLSNSLSSVQQTSSNVSSSIGGVSASAATSSKNLTKASSAMAEFGKQSALAVKRFAAFSFVTSGVFALINAVNSATKAFIDFDQQTITLQQVTGKGAIGVRALTTEITRLATTYGVSSAALIDAATTLAQAGLSASETQTALEALAKTELAPSFDDMTQTTEGVIAAMRQFGIEAKDLDAALGSINAVSAAFAVEASDIISAIQRTGGVFASASHGVSEGTDALNEFIAVFTSVRATTRESAETIATGLRTIFTRIQRASTIEALQEFGIELQDLDGKFVGPYEAVKRLSEGLKMLDTRDIRFSGIVEELGGFRQIGKVIPLIQQFSTAQDALKVAQSGQASTAKDAMIAQQSLANQISKVREQFLALIRDVGQSSTFQGFFKIVMGLTSGLISLASAFKPILPLLAIMGAVKGFNAITQFAGGFASSFSKGGGAQAAGQNIGSSLTGSKDKEKADATSKAADAIISNTNALTTLTSTISVLTTHINSLSAAVNTNTSSIKGSSGGGTGGTTLNKGGVVRKFASGGSIQRFARGGVPALVSNGEGWVPPEKVASFGGYKELDKLNQADRNGMGRYAAGGGIEVFKGPGSGTSDKIKANLAIGGYVLRAGAMEALGFNKGGSVGVRKFAKGSMGGVKKDTPEFSIDDVLNRSGGATIKEALKYTNIESGELGDTASATINSVPVSLSKGDYKRIWDIAQEKAAVSKGKYKSYAGIDVSKDNRDLLRKISTGPRKPRNKGKTTAPSNIGQLLSAEGRWGKAYEQVLTEKLGDNWESASGISSYPVDLVRKLKDESIASIGEAKFRSVPTDEIDLVSKMLRYRIDKKTTGKYFTEKTNKDRDISPKTNVGVLDYFWANDQKSKFYDWIQEQQEQKIPGFNRGGLVQKFAEGGKTTRRIGIIDSDVLRQTANAEKVSEGMKSIGSESITDYTIQLAKLAVQRRKSDNLKKFRVIAGAAGSGKSSLATGVSANDNAVLRETVRSHILTPQDLDNVDEVLTITANVSDAKLEGYLRDADRTYTLSSDTKAEQNLVRDNKDSRDITGKLLYDREPGRTKGVSPDFGVEQATLMDELGSKNIVLGRKKDAEGNLTNRFRRKRGDELPEIVQAEGFYTGGFAPPTRGHRGAFDTLLANVLAKNPNATLKDILVSVAPNVAMVEGKEGLDHAARYGIFDADFRSLLADVNFKGAMISQDAQSTPGILPKVMEVPGENNRRKFARLKGAMAITSGKDKGVLGKYDRAGIQVTDIPRIEDISATTVRELLFSQNYAELDKIVNPEVGSILKGNQPQLKNRSVMVPVLLEEINKAAKTNAELANKQVDDILQNAPGGPYRNVSKELRAQHPEIAEQIEKIRAQRDSFKKSVSGAKAHDIIRQLASSYPEIYGIDPSRRAATAAAAISAEDAKSHIGDRVSSLLPEEATTAGSSLLESIRQNVTKQLSIPKGAGTLPTDSKTITSAFLNTKIPSDPTFGIFSGKAIDPSIVKKVWRQTYPGLSEDKTASYTALKEWLQAQYNARTGAKTEELSQAIQESRMVGLVGMLPIGHERLSGPFTWMLGKNAAGEDVSVTASILERGLGKQYEEAVREAQSHAEQGSELLASGLASKMTKRPESLRSLDKNQLETLGQGNIEGAYIEQALARLWANLDNVSTRTRPIDYPDGLGESAELFPGISPNMPTEVKRTINSDSRSDAIEEFQRYFRLINGIPEPEAKKEAVQALSIGGMIERFAAGGDTQELSKYRLNSKENRDKVNLDSLMQDTLPSMLYSGFKTSRRGIIEQGLDKSKDYNPQELVNKTFTMPSYLSTSATERGGRSFGDVRGGLLHIATSSQKKGIDVIRNLGNGVAPGLYEREAEFILPKQSSFKINDVLTNKGPLGWNKDWSPADFLELGVQQLAVGGKASRGVDLDKEFMANPVPSPFNKTVSKKLGPEVYDLEKGSGLSSFEFDETKRLGDAAGDTIEQFKKRLAERAEAKKQRSQIKTDSSALLQQLTPQGRTLSPKQLALAEQLKGEPDAGYRPILTEAQRIAANRSAIRGSALEDINNATRYATGGVAQLTPPSLPSPPKKPDPNAQVKAIYQDKEMDAIKKKWPIGTKIASGDWKLPGHRSVGVGQFAGDHKELTDFGGSGWKMRLDPKTDKDNILIADWFLKNKSLFSGYKIATNTDKPVWSAYVSRGTGPEIQKAAQKAQSDLGKFITLNQAYDTTDTMIPGTGISGRFEIRGDERSGGPRAQGIVDTINERRKATTKYKNFYLQYKNSPGFSKGFPSSTSGQGGVPGTSYFQWLLQMKKDARRGTNPERAKELQAAQDEEIKLIESVLKEKTPEYSFNSQQSSGPKTRLAPPPPPAPPKKFAVGGSIPALVSNGEGWVPPEQVASFGGYDALDLMNQADRNGMGKYSRGGNIGVFKGPGSGTSDSIRANLAVGGYVVRERAMKALGFNKGGAVGVRKFAGGSPGGVGNTTQTATGTEGKQKDPLIAKIQDLIQSITKLKGTIGAPKADKAKNDLEEIIGKLGLGTSSNDQATSEVRNIVQILKAAMPQNKNQAASLENVQAASASVSQKSEAESAARDAESTPRVREQNNEERLGSLKEKLEKEAKEQGKDLLSYLKEQKANLESTTTATASTTDAATVSVDTAENKPIDTSEQEKQLDNLIKQIDEAQKKLNQLSNKKHKLTVSTDPKTLDKQIEDTQKQLDKAYLFYGGGGEGSTRRGKYKATPAQSGEELIQRYKESNPYTYNGGLSEKDTEYFKGMSSEEAKRFSLMENVGFGASYSSQGGMLDARNTGRTTSLNNKTTAELETLASTSFGSLDPKLKTIQDLKASLEDLENKKLNIDTSSTASEIEAIDKEITVLREHLNKTTTEASAIKESIDATKPPTTPPTGDGSVPPGGGSVPPGGDGGGPTPEDLDALISKETKDRNAYNDNQFFEYKARKEGVTSKGYKQNIARQLGKAAYEVSDNYKGRTQEMSYELAGRQESIASIGSTIQKAKEASNKKTATDEEKAVARQQLSDAQSRLAMEAENIAKSMRDLNPSLDMVKVQDASKKIADLLSSGQLKEAQDKLVETLGKAPEGSEAMNIAMDQLAKQLGISKDILERNFGEGGLEAKEVKRQQFVQSREGQRYGALAEYAPDMLSKFSGTRTGKTLGSGADFISGKGGKFSQLFSKMGGLTTIGASLSVAAEKFQKSVTITNPNTAGIVGGIGGAGSGLASGAALGAQVAGPVGALIAGIGGAIIGGITGAFDAFNTKRLENNIKLVENSASDLNTALKKLAENASETNAAVVSAKSTKLLQDSGDLREQANLGRGGMARSAVEFLRAYDPTGISNSVTGGTVEKEARDAFVSQTLVPYVDAQSSLGDVRRNKISTDQLQEVRSRIDARTKAAAETKDPAKIAEAEKLNREELLKSSQTVRQLIAPVSEGGKGHSLDEALITMGTTQRKKEGKDFDQDLSTAEGRAKLREEGAKLAAQEEDSKNRTLLLSRAMREMSIETDHLIETYRRAGAYITRFGDELEAFDAKLNNNINSLRGQASVGPVDRSNEKILGNLSGYSNEEVKGAADRVAQLAGGGKAGADLGQQVQMNKILQDQLPQILKGATDENINEGDNSVMSQIKEALSVVGEPPKALLDEIEAKLRDKTGGREGGTSLSDIGDDTGAFVNSLKAAQAATNLSIALEKQYNDALQRTIGYQNEYGKALQEVADYQMQAKDIRLKGEIQLKEALGERMSLDEINAPQEARIKGLTTSVVQGGTTDPGKILEAMQREIQSKPANEKDLEAKRQAYAASGAEPDKAAFEAQARLVAEQNNSINNSRKALEELAKDGTGAANALKGLAEQQKVAQGGVNFMQKVLTSDGAQLAEIDKNLQAYTKVISGKASNKELDSVKFRQQAFGGLSEISSMMPDSLKNQMQATLIENMAASSPGLSKVLDTKTGGTFFNEKTKQYEPMTYRSQLNMVKTGKDPIQQQYIDAYKEATARQADAADRLGEAAQSVADELLKGMTDVLGQIKDSLSTAVPRALVDTTTPQVAPAAPVVDPKLIYSVDPKSIEDMKAALNIKNIPLIWPTGAEKSMNQLWYAITGLTAAVVALTVVTALAGKMGFLKNIPILKNIPGFGGAMDDAAKAAAKAGAGGADDAAKAAGKAAAGGADDAARAAGATDDAARAVGRVDDVARAAATEAATEAATAAATGVDDVAKAGASATTAATTAATEAATTAATEAATTAATSGDDVVKAGAAAAGSVDEVAKVGSLATKLAPVAKVLGAVGLVADVGIGGYTGYSSTSEQANANKENFGQTAGTVYNTAMGSLTGSAETGQSYTGYFTGMEQGSALNNVASLGEATARGALAGSAFGPGGALVGATVGAGAETAKMSVELGRQSVGLYNDRAIAAEGAAKTDKMLEASKSTNTYGLDFTELSRAKDEASVRVRLGKAKAGGDSVEEARLQKELESLKNIRVKDREKDDYFSGYGGDSKEFTTAVTEMVAQQQEADKALQNTESSETAKAKTKTEEGSAGLASESKPIYMKVLEDILTAIKPSSTDSTTDTASIDTAIEDVSAVNAAEVLPKVIEETEAAAAVSNITEPQPIDSLQTDSKPIYMKVLEDILGSLVRPQEKQTITDQTTQPSALKKLDGTSSTQGGLPAEIISLMDQKNLSTSERDTMAKLYEQISANIPAGMASSAGGAFSIPPEIAKGLNGIAGKGSDITASAMDLFKRAKTGGAGDLSSMISSIAPQADIEQYIRSSLGLLANPQPTTTGGPEAQKAYEQQVAMLEEKIGQIEKRAVPLRTSVAQGFEQDKLELTKAESEKERIRGVITEIPKPGPLTTTPVSPEKQAFAEEAKALLQKMQITGGSSPAVLQAAVQGINQNKTTAPTTTTGTAVFGPVAPSPAMGPALPPANNRIDKFIANAQASQLEAAPSNTPTSPSQPVAPAAPLTPADLKAKKVASLKALQAARAKLSGLGKDGASFTDEDSAALEADVMSKDKEYKSATKEYGESQLSPANKAARERNKLRTKKEEAKKKLFAAQESQTNNMASSFSGQSINGMTDFGLVETAKVASAEKEYQSLQTSSQLAGGEKYNNKMKQNKAFGALTEASNNVESLEREHADSLGMSYGDLLADKEKIGAFRQSDKYKEAKQKEGDARLAYKEVKDLPTVGDYFDKSGHKKNTGYAAMMTGRRQAYLSKFRPEVRERMMTKGEKDERDLAQAKATQDAVKPPETPGTSGPSLISQADSNQFASVGGPVPTAVPVQTTPQPPQQQGLSGGPQGAPYSLILDEASKQFLASFGETLNLFGSNLQQMNIAPVSQGPVPTAVPASQMSQQQNASSPSGGNASASGPSPSYSITLDESSKQFLSDFGNKLNNFGSYVQQLSSIHIPDKIQMTGTHTVDVKISGAAAIEALDERMKKLVYNAISEKMGKIWQQSGGQLGDSPSMPVSKSASQA